MIEATWESYQPFLAGLAAVQEQNVMLARHSAGMFLRGIERQREAMQTTIEGSFRAYTGFLYAPVSSPSKELKEYETKNRNRHAVVERFDRSLV